MTANQRLFALSKEDLFKALRARVENLRVSYLWENEVIFTGNRVAERAEELTAERWADFEKIRVAEKEGQADLALQLRKQILGAS